MAFRTTDYLAPRFWPSWLALGLLRASITLPWRWQCALGRGLGALFHLLHRSRRAICRANIDACFPALGAEERARLVRESFAHTGITAFETALAWWGRDDWLAAHCEVAGLAHLREALGAGKGVILLTGHSTSLEIGGRLLVPHTPMQVMYRTVRNELVNAVTLHVRSRHFVRVILRTRLRETLRGLAENLPTWYAPDQDFGRRGTVFADFFGVPASTLTATARLARLSGAPVLPFYPYRRADGKGWRLVIEPALSGFPCGDEQVDARRVNEVLERQVAVAPAQYLWVHKRFKTRPPGAPPLYPRR